MTLEAGKAVALRSDGRRSLRLIGQKLLKTLHGPQFPVGPEDPRHAIKNGGHSSRKKAVAGALLSEPLLERELFPYRKVGCPRSREDSRSLPWHATPTAAGWRASPEWVWAALGLGG